MKKTVIYLLMAGAAFFTISCSKKNDPAPTSTTLKFVVNGNTYTETASSDSLESVNDQPVYVLGVAGQSTDKSASAQIILLFPGSTKPKAGSYLVAGDATTKTTGNYCAMLITDKVSVAKQGIYSPTGLDGKSVVVAVSSSGKLTVTMPTIAIKGNNYDNTNPNNTVVTDVTGSVSGTAGDK